MDYIAASSDRVVVHQALKHLIVGGNALLFMGKEGLKLFPLHRYVLERDGNGNVIEIVTKEKISKKLLPEFADELNLGSDGKILFTIRDYKSLYQKLKNMNFEKKYENMKDKSTVTINVDNIDYKIPSFVIFKKFDNINLEDIYNGLNFSRILMENKFFIPNNLRLPYSRKLLEEKIL